jgi:hypothetical protein
MKRRKEEIAGSVPFVVPSCPTAAILLAHMAAFVTLAQDLFGLELVRSDGERSVCLVRLALSQVCAPPGCFTTPSCLLTSFSFHVIQRPSTVVQPTRNGRSRVVFLPLDHCRFLSTLHLRRMWPRFSVRADCTAAVKCSALTTVHCWCCRALEQSSIISIEGDKCSYEVVLSPACVSCG